MSDLETRYARLRALTRATINELEQNAKLLETASNRLTSVAVVCSGAAKSLHNMAKDLEAEIEDE